MPMADGEYDVVVMGTGFAECLLSGLLCVAGTWSKLCTCVQCVNGNGLRVKQGWDLREGDRHHLGRPEMALIVVPTVADEPDVTLHQHRSFVYIPLRLHNKSNVPATTTQRHEGAGGRPESLLWWTGGLAESDQPLQEIQ